MEKESVKIVNLTSFRTNESKGKIPVPKWILDMLEVCEEPSKIKNIIKLIKNDKSLEDLCRRKSIHLARIRKKVIENETEGKHE